jgi:hypothetical protein
LLIVGRHQLGFGIQAAQPLDSGRLIVGSSEHAWLPACSVGVNEMHRLAIEMGIERTDIVLVVVHVQLRLSGVGVAVLRLKTWNCLVDTVASKF